VVVIIMKTPSTSNSRRIAVIALLLAATTTIVTVSIAIPIVKPVYAESLDISGEQIVGGEEEIPDSDDIREKAREIISQSVPRLPEQATALFGFRPPPAFAA
jgi:hypothetical protein